jgi:hypothetical protein
MPVKGDLSIKDVVEIEFSAHHANTGTTIVNTGYVPRPSKPPAAVTPPIIPVAPGASAIQRTTVKDAFALIIDVDVPPAGGGQLEVRVNGALKDSGPVAGDVNWSYLVL